MSGPVVVLRQPCGACEAERDMEFAVAGEPYQSPFLSWVRGDHHDGWCLSCGDRGAYFFEPGEFARALQSARYLAA